MERFLRHAITVGVPELRLSGSLFVLPQKFGFLGNRSITLLDHYLLLLRILFIMFVTKALKQY